VVATPDSQKIYREQGSTSYTDWMYQNSEWKKIAEYDFPGVDEEPTAGSVKPVQSGGVLDSIIKDGSAFDLSVYTGDSYASLSAALTAMAALSTAYKKGGMSIKYIQSSDNKYVQYIYTGTALTGTPNPFLQPGNWQLVENPNVQKLATTQFEEEWDVTVGNGGHTFYLNLPAGVYEMTVENVDANNQGTFSFYFTPSDAPVISPQGRIDVKRGFKLNKAITRITIGDINASITQAGKMKLVIRNAESLSSEISDLQRRDESEVEGIFINGNIDSGSISSYKMNERIVSLNYFKYSRNVKITADSGYSFYCITVGEAGSGGWVTQYQVAANTEFRLIITAGNETTSLDALKSHIKISTVGDNALSLVGYYECSTAAGTAAKEISAPQYTLIVGGSMKVKMTNSNTAANATLNIGGTGAKPLYYKGSRASASNSWIAGEVMEVFYDGTNYYANNVQGAGDDVYDISSNHIVNDSPTQYSNLASALGTNGANVPADKRSGGMSVKFIRQILAVYRVVKTTGLESAPSGATELDSAPSVVSGTYNASQLSAFTTLPANVWASVVYYVEVSGDTTTYTSWTITKLSVDSSQYVQYRYLQNSTANATFATVANWKSVNDEAISAISENNLQIRRKINVTAGSGIPTSALNDIVLEPGVYEFILRNVTTDNHGRYQLYGAATLGGNIDAKLAIRVTESGAKNFWVGDIGAAITTTGVMEAVITKKVDSPLFKTEEAINAVVNKPGGILFGDFFYGTTSSTYMNYRRISNQTRIYFEKEALLTTKSNAYRFFLIGYSEKEGGSVTVPYTDWTQKYTVPAGTYVIICIEKSTYSTSSIALPVDELTNAIIIKDPNEEIIQELSTKVSALEEKAPDELYITPVKGGIGPDGSYNSMTQRIRGNAITYADKDYFVFTDPIYWVSVVFYQQDGTFINFASGNNNIEIPKGSYFNLFIGRQDYVTIDISEWKHLHIIPKVSKGLFNYDSYDVIERNKEAFNNILAAQKHSRQSSEDNSGNSDKKFTIAHISDIHDDVVRMRNFNTFVSYLDSLVTTCVLTGDFVTLPIEAHYNYIMPTVDANTKLLKVVGNHEKTQNDLKSGSPTYGQTFYNTRAEMYENLNMDTPTGKLYYYQDFMNKFRVIVLNQYDTDAEIWPSIEYTQEQIDWFISTLKDAATNNLHVIVACHQPELTPRPNNKGFYQRYSASVWHEYDGTTETIVEDIINAFKHAGTVSGTYRNNISINETFSDAGIFVAYMCGHYHADLIGYSSKYEDQLYLLLSHSGFTDNATTICRVIDTGSDVLRIPSCKFEDLFNVYVFDDVNRLIRVIRVGSDTVDDMTDRKKACFSY